MNRLLWIAIVLMAVQLLVNGNSIRYTGCPDECKCEKKTSSSIMSCKNLMSENKIGNIPITHFQISQSEQPLTMTESVFVNMGLKHVTVISISNSTISSIDKMTFQGLNELTHIELMHSNISSIHPETFKQNPNLKHLNLVGSPLDITSVFVSETIEELDVSFCNLSAINPKLFEKLPSVTYLDVSGNNIEKLPPNVFDSLTSLQEINLSRNKLQTIPNDIFLKNIDLDVLDLSYNPLTSFSGDQLYNVVTLFLKSCSLQQIDKYMFRNMSSLSNLDLSNNQITNIDPRAFAGMKSLSAIDLSNNDIRLLNENLFVNNSMLQKLNLDNNKNLVKLPMNGFKPPGGISFNIIRFSCSNCNLRGLTKTMLKAMPTLVTLNLSKNQISDISIGTFQPLTSLIELDLSENQIVTIDKNTFKENTNLKTLHLAHNTLKSMHPNIFKENENLQFLDLSYCGLFQLWTAPAGSISLDSLHSLNISNNNIKFLKTEDISVANNLKSLDLSNNPLECKPELKQLIEYLHDHDIKNVQYLMNEKQTYDMEDEDSENAEWKDLVKSVCEGDDQSDDDYDDDEEDDDEEYNDDLYDDKVGANTDINLPEGDILDNEEEDEEEDEETIIPLDSKHQIRYRYSVVWPVLVFIGTALAVLGIVANAILFVLRRRQTLTIPMPRIINVSSKSLLKKNSGLVYQQLSEEHGPKTPILSRLTLPTAHGHEPENV